MVNKEQIKDHIRKIALNGNRDIDSIVLATVDQINGVTIDCTPLDTSMAQILGARLVSAEHDTNFIITPAIGSVVGLIGDSDNEMTEFSAVLFSEIDTILIRGDQFGGLVKVGDLVDKINTIENDINDLKTIFSAWVPFPNDGGSALKTAAATWYATQITNTTVENLENTNVKHG